MTIQNNRDFNNSDVLKSELCGLVECIAAWSVGRRPISEEHLFMYTAEHFPYLWRRFNGGFLYCPSDNLKSDLEEDFFEGMR